MIVKVVVVFNKNLSVWTAKRVGTLLKKKECQKHIFFTLFYNFIFQDNLIIVISIFIFFIFQKSVKNVKNEGELSSATITAHYNLCSNSTDSPQFDTSRDINDVIRCNASENLSTPHWPARILLVQKQPWTSTPRTSHIA